ncbi:MAG: hypothetical protein COU29_02525 [Candidatus Magasanikbacteria bacterium CG10_big_fil_rev_8_21_14_0_10_36_32]|uniref:ABC transporter substrate-binding protein n=1 Tax=Candidatus Magasanikbacteria bacterium CG10_big_fil_rev_8_21_14_0_10_36_32 TaxID=1974646 RepID=A0A2M6W7B4_9BACT|nr:MAG: hypothetical protein COU29_02525 [Candidatus Magasanikbacteria bacterium CG10_big_fil_rev_8_21_14_0_10_36_32]
MIKITKKFYPLFLVVVFLLFSGFGCKGLSQTELQATKSVELEYWTVYDDVDAMQAQINNYRAQRPYLTVTIRQLRADELYPRLIEALAEDKGPDIVSVQAKNIRSFQSKLATMPSSVKDTTITVQKNVVGTETIVNTASINLPSVSQIDREYVQTVKKDVIVDNKIYGLPMSLDTMAIYYNKDLLDRSGVPEPPTNWNDFQAAVRKITKYNKETGQLIQSGAALGSSANIENFDDILYILFKQSDVDFIDRNGRVAFHVVPSNLKSSESPSTGVMSFYTDFANSARDTYTWNSQMENSLDSFTKGKVAFFFGYSYHNGIIKTRAPQLNYGVTPMIQLNAEKPVNAADYWIQAVVQKSKKQNEAWGLINYLTHSSKAVEEYLTATKRPAAMRSLINKQKEDVDLSPFAGQLLIAENWYRGKNYDGASQALGAMVEEWLNTPITDASRVAQWQQDVLNRAASKVNQTF